MPPPEQLYTAVAALLTVVEHVVPDSVYPALQAYTGEAPCDSVLVATHDDPDSDCPLGHRYPIDAAPLDVMTQLDPDSEPPDGQL